jgi:hypothetical protein
MAKASKRRRLAMGGVNFRSSVANLVALLKHPCGALTVRQGYANPRAVHLQCGTGGNSEIHGSGQGKAWRGETPSRIYSIGGDSAVGTTRKDSQPRSAPARGGAIEAGGLPL